MKRRLIAIALLLLAAGIAGWPFRSTLLATYDRVCDLMLDESLPSAPGPDPTRYRVLCSELEQWRAQLAERHLASEDKEQQQAIEAEARVLLEHMLPALMRCWIGTPWDFNGTAAKPGDGKIACGYFVSTVLRDAGFRVNRYRLAQQASANIIHSFIPTGACTLSVGMSYENFLAELDEYELGIYLVGLDTHVAFLVKTTDGFRFIHSSGSKPWCVVDEGRDEAGVLQRSRWRMLGKLSASPEFIRTWLGGEAVRVVRN